MGMFGAQKTYGTPGINPNAPAPMGIDTSVPTDPFAGQRPKGGGIFGAAGSRQRDVWGALADWFSQQGGGQPIYRQGREKQEDRQAELQQAMMLAKLKQGNDDSPYVRDAMAIGLTPGSPEFARWVTRMRSAPKVMQTDQGIYNMDTDNYGLWGGEQGGGQPATKQIGDTTYYMVDGEWYDNREGK